MEMINDGLTGYLLFWHFKNSLPIGNKRFLLYGNNLPVAGFG